MKIAEETGDGDLKEAAKVNFGMANASMKWTNHVSNILHNLHSGDPAQGGIGGVLEEEDEEGEALMDDGVKFPDIHPRSR
jgi:hypothetical protein